MIIIVHHDKCGYWAEWKSEGKKVSASLVQLVEAFEHRPIRKGRWKGAGLGSYMCSCCGEKVGTKYTYCPYCGVPMATDGYAKAKEDIVRCKDCKWFTERNGEHLCGAWEEIFYNPVDADGYCYRGERKDGGENE